MIDDIMTDAEERMGKSLESLDKAFARIRTGRAHPSLLEPIVVSYYGVDTPLRQVANITVEDARMLAVTPWEKPMVQEVEKAIIKSGLGLNPSTAGMVIRVPLPPLTEETRHGYTRQARQEAENARVSISNIRRDAISDFKDLEKEKMISEDESHSAQDAIQKLTNSYVAKADEALKAKESDLMEV